MAIIVQSCVVDWQHFLARLVCSVDHDPVDASTKEDLLDWLESVTKQVCGDLHPLVLNGQQARDKWCLHLGEDIDISSIVHALNHHILLGQHSLPAYDLGLNPLPYARVVPLLQNAPDMKYFQMDSCWTLGLGAIPLTNRTAPQCLACQCI